MGKWESTFISLINKMSWTKIPYIFNGQENMSYILHKPINHKRTEIRHTQRKLPTFLWLIKRQITWRTRTELIQTPHLSQLCTPDSIQQISIFQDGAAINNYQKVFLCEMHMTIHFEHRSLYFSKSKYINRIGSMLTWLILMLTHVALPKEAALKKL